MQTLDGISGYKYSDASVSCAHSYLLPCVFSEIDTYFAQHRHDRRIFDLGCGNGSVAAKLVEAGYEVCGVDPSQEGIAYARHVYPDIRLENGSGYEDLCRRFGRFPVVISLEVIEHVYAPREFTRNLFELTNPGGIVIVSTPYHGYLKNLALAVSGKLDSHFTALWDHGHVKFWSIRTMNILLVEAGFRNIRFLRVGRVPALAKAMIAVAQRPDALVCHDI